MIDSARIRQRIQARISQGEFLGNLLRVARHESRAVQAEFLESLTNISAGLRDLFLVNGLIKKLDYSPTVFWPSQKGKAIAFVDGGVANVDMPSAAPIGIRVGSYIVRPGDESPNRERFRIELALVDDLYSPEGEVFDEEFQDLAKLRDAARIASETAAAFRLSGPTEEVDVILLHGPLINPVSPYGLNDFPKFGLNAIREFLGDPAWKDDGDNRNFIPAYLEILERMQASAVPVFGVVERALGKDPVVTRRILFELQDKSILRADRVQEILVQLGLYGLNDTSLLDVVLEPGEYVTWISVNRQGPESKWPDRWKPWIRKIPNAHTTFLKPSDSVLPFRVEAFNNNLHLDVGIELIFNTSRLLPNYGFPVGLDIVDKFAKVPAWMSKGIRGQHQVVLLRNAMEHGDPKAIAYAMKMLTAKGRDWLFRPQA